MNRRRRWSASSDEGDVYEAKHVTTRRVEIERFTVTSPKPFEAVLAALRAAVGNPDMAEFVGAIKRAPTFAEFEDFVRKSVGRTG